MKRRIHKIKNRWLRVFVYVHLGLLFLAVCFGMDVYLSSRNTYKTSMNISPFEAIIVPGVPYYGSKMSRIMRMRVLWAKHLYDSDKATHIIFSGSAVYTPYVEAEVMAAFAEELDIPKNAILIESKAEHSTENLYYAYKMARKAGFEKIAVTTDPFQSYFLKIFAERHGIKTNFLPFQLGMDSIFDLDLAAVKIKLEKHKSFVSLPERESIIERIKGTLGKHIPRNSDNEIFPIDE